jgi:hypothetical protein
MKKWNFTNNSLNLELEINYELTKSNEKRKKIIKPIFLKNEITYLTSF